MTAITIGHDSGLPKRITRPRQLPSWNLGLALIGNPFEQPLEECYYKVVNNPDKSQAGNLVSKLRLERRLRSLRVFAASTRARLAELDLQRGPKHLLDIGWMRRNWGWITE